MCLSKVYRSVDKSIFQVRLPFTMVRLVFFLMTCEKNPFNSENDSRKGSNCWIESIYLPLHLLHYF